MALSKSQTQKLWRARRDIKARFFEDLDHERQCKLAFPKSVTDKPEGVALAQFFVNYPLCRIAPVGLALKDGAWVVVFNRPHDRVSLEAAAAITALREVSSLPVTIRAPGAGLPLREVEQLAAEIADEVRDMRAARMWGAQ